MLFFKNFFRSFGSFPSIIFAVAFKASAESSNLWNAFSFTLAINN